MTDALSSTEDLPPLTARQRAVLTFLCDVEDRWGRPATVHEVQDRFGFASPHAYVKYCVALTKKGYMRKDPTCHKAYRVQRYPDGTLFPSRQDLKDEVLRLRLALSLSVLSLPPTPNSDKED